MPLSDDAQPFHRADSLRQRRLGLHFILGRARAASASRSCQTLGVMAPTREQVDAELKRVVAPELRRLGFKGTYPNFYRDRAGHLDLVTIQFSSAGGKFVVELSYADRSRKNVYAKREAPPAKLRVSQTTNRFRLGTLAPHDDHWFLYPGAEANLSALCTKVNELLNTQGADWWLAQSDA